MRFTTFVFAFSILALAACGDDGNSEKPAVCGDSIVGGGEACDDGNSTDGDGCNNDCQLSGCGDGIMEFTEACDDGNQVDGDGCDSNCTETFCGNGIVTDGEVCDDGNGHDGDGCDSTCRPTGCGNGAMAGDEECDDGNEINGDGCDMNCTVTACGNGIMTDGEQCDDSNTVSADGCSSTCNDETPEIEPNEDGSPSIGDEYELGNDFAIVNADMHPAITGNVTITAAIDPAGDEDVFKVTNTGTAMMQITADTWDLATGYGVGVACDLTDTVVNVRDASGVVLASNDDRDANNDDYCSQARVGLAAGQSAYIQVLAHYDDTPVTLYALDVQFAPVVCGDSEVGPGETCDDGNTMASDGCSATCQIEGAIAEVEPNEDGTPSTGGDEIDGNDFGTANPDANAPITGSTRILAGFVPAGDEDIFKITNTGTTPMDVTLDTWYLATGYGVGVACDDSDVFDTGILVKNAAGAELARNDDRVVSTDFCSHVVTGLLPGESRYVQVVFYDDATVAMPYLLDVTYAPTVCGDNAIGAGETCDDGGTTPGDGCSATCQIEEICGDSDRGPTEQCDDGNVISGDGCSATCQLEGVTAEVEPNEDGTPQTGGSGIVGNDFGTTNPDAHPAITANAFITAAITPAGDEDIFKITNNGTSPAQVFFDVWNLAPGYGVGVPCAESIDTGMALRDAAGMVLDSNDDRNSAADRCSTLNRVLAPGESVYAHVIEYGDDGQIATYALQVRVVPIVCGDGVRSPGEQCDDGNTVNGDGCTATCTGIPEVEPNDDGATSSGPANGIDGNDFATANPDANASFTSSVTIQSSINPAGDEDIYKFTNSAAASKNVRFDIWNGDPNYGVGVPCGTSIDTGLVVRDSAGTELDSNDDRNFSSDRCSGIDVTIAAGTSVYVHVVEYDDDGAIPSYIFTAAYAP